MKYLLTVLAILLLFTTGCKKKKDDAPLPVIPTSPITADVSTPSSPQTGDITIDYTLTDDRIPPENADIEVFYSANGGWFMPATQGSGGDGTTNLACAAAPGAPHTFVWDSLGDLAPGFYDVVIKIVPYETDSGELGVAGQSASFQVVIGEPSVTPQVKVYDPKMPGAGAMTVQYRIDPIGVFSP